MRPFRPLFVVATVCALFAGCSDQGEGERCDPNNGNLDCQSGLNCIKASDLAVSKGSADKWGLCCPANPQAATIDACFRKSTILGDGAVGDSATPPSDAGHDAADAHGG